MQLVIDIHERDYQSILNGHIPFSVLDVIRNGTLLPEGHGRLGDLDKLEREMIGGIRAGNYIEGYEKYAHINDMDDCIECVQFADTIVEADKEGEDGTEIN